MNREKVFEKYSSLPKDSPERKLLQSKLEDISSTRVNVTIKDQKRFETNEKGSSKNG